MHLRLCGGQLNRSGLLTWRWWWRVRGVLNTCSPVFRFGSSHEVFRVERAGLGERETSEIKTKTNENMNIMPFTRLRDQFIPPKSVKTTTVCVCLYKISCRQCNFTFMMCYTCGEPREVFTRIRCNDSKIDYKKTDKVLAVRKKMGIRATSGHEWS
jgi:hypothetical protein